MTRQSLLLAQLHLGLRARLVVDRRLFATRAFRRAAAMRSGSVTAAPLDQAADGAEEAWSLEERHVHLLAVDHELLRLSVLLLHDGMAWMTRAHAHPGQTLNFAPVVIQFYAYHGELSARNVALHTRQLSFQHYNSHAIADLRYYV